MSDEKQAYKLAEEHKEQSGGWFTSPPSEAWSGTPQQGNNFFDRPPFLFAAFVWLFPYAHIVLTGFTIRGIVFFFKHLDSKHLTSSHSIS